MRGGRTAGGYCWGVRPLVIMFAVCALLLVGCGAGPTPLVTVQAAGAKTTAVRTAKMALSLKSDTGPYAQGVNIDGAFDFGARRGRFTLDPSSFGIPLQQGQIDSIFDYASGFVIYLHLPQLAQGGGKPWLKIDVAAVAKARLGVDITGIIQSQSSDPASGLRLLQGANEVTKIGTEVVRGVQTTHYRVVIDLAKAVQASPAQYRDAMQKLISLYTVKTLPIDVWLDGQNRVRRYEQTVDASIIRLPASAQAANAATGKVTIRYELYDFGSPVEVQLPAADQVTDFSQLGQGSATFSSAGTSM